MSHMQMCQFQPIKLNNFFSIPFLSGNVKLQQSNWPPVLPQTQQKPRVTFWKRLMPLFLKQNYIVWNQIFCRWRRQAACGHGSLFRKSATKIIWSTITLVYLQAKSSKFYLACALVLRFTTALVGVYSSCRWKTSYWLLWWNWDATSALSTWVSAFKFPIQQFQIFSGHGYLFFIMFCTKVFCPANLHHWPKIRQVCHAVFQLFQVAELFWIALRLRLPFRQSLMPNHGLTRIINIGIHSKL